MVLVMEPLSRFNSYVEKTYSNVMNIGAFVPIGWVTSNKGNSKRGDNKDLNHHSALAKKTCEYFIQRTTIHIYHTFTSFIINVIYEDDNVISMLLSYFYIPQFEYQMCEHLFLSCTYINFFYFMSLLY